jgi:ligand-binding sensor domain-containing protein
LRSSSTCRNNSKLPQNYLYRLGAALACVGFSRLGLALDPSRGLSQYVHQAWGQEQGLSGGAIYAITRSPDGYLWIGADRGLVRFDGASFDLIRQPIPNLPPIGSVRSLATDVQGTLWIVPEGAHLLLYRGWSVFKRIYFAQSAQNDVHGAFTR